MAFVFKRAFVALLLLVLLTGLLGWWSMHVQAQTFPQLWPHVSVQHSHQLAYGGRYPTCPPPPYICD